VLAIELSKRHTADPCFLARGSRDTSLNAPLVLSRVDCLYSGRPGHSNETGKLVSHEFIAILISLASSDYKASLDGCKVLQRKMQGAFFFRTNQQGSCWNQ